MAAVGLFKMAERCFHVAVCQGDQPIEFVGPLYLESHVLLSHLLPVGVRQIRLPDVERAYRLPSPEPTSTTPPPTRGEEKISPPVANVHFTFPVGVTA